MTVLPWMRILGCGALEVACLRRRGSRGVQHQHLARVFSEGQRFLDPRIAGTGDDDLLVAQHRPVATGAMAHALAREAFLAGHAQHAVARTRGHDERARKHHSFARGDLPATRCRGHGHQLAHLEFGAGRHGLFLDHGAEVVTGHALRESGKVLDLVDRAQVAPGHQGDENERRTPQARAEQSCRQPGHAATGDDHIVCLQVTFLFVNPGQSITLSAHTPLCRRPASIHAAPALRTPSMRQQPGVTPPLNASRPRTPRRPVAPLRCASSHWFRRRPPPR